MQEAVTNQYADNLQKQSEIQADLTKAQKQYNKALDEYAKALEEYTKTWDGNAKKAFKEAE